MKVLLIPPLALCAALAWVRLETRPEVRSFVERRVVPIVQVLQTPRARFDEKELVADWLERRTREERQVERILDYRVRTHMVCRGLLDPEQGG